MVRTGIVRRVLDAEPALQVVIVSPMASDSEFVRELSHPRLTFESLPAHRPAGMEAKLLALMQAAYIDSGITESVRIRRMEAQAKGTIRWIRRSRRRRMLALTMCRRARLRRAPRVLARAGKAVAEGASEGWRGRAPDSWHARRSFCAMCAPR
jgi:hypothetical protein